MRSNRLLPEPDAPVMATHSPASTASSNGPATPLRRLAIRSRAVTRATSSLGELAQQSSVRADAVVEAAQLELLVRAVHLIVVEAEPHQQAVDAERPAERLHHRDRAATAHQQRRP